MAGWPDPVQCPKCGKVYRWMPDDDTLMGTKVEVGEALDTSGRTVSFTLHRCRKAKCGCIVAIETDEAGEGNMYLPADQ